MLHNNALTLEFVMEGRTQDFYLTGFQLLKIELKRCIFLGSSLVRPCMCKVVIHTQTVNWYVPYLA